MVISGCRFTRVYPRVCGETKHGMDEASMDAGLSPRVRETCVWEWEWLWWSGLSPRVRGNLGLKAGDLGPLGSIPACAGKPPRFY